MTCLSPSGGFVHQPQFGHSLSMPSETLRWGNLGKVSVIFRENSGFRCPFVNSWFLYDSMRSADKYTHVIPCDNVTIILLKNINKLLYYSIRYYIRICVLSTVIVTNNLLSYWGLENTVGEKIFIKYWLDFRSNPNSRV